MDYTIKSRIALRKSPDGSASILTRLEAGSQVSVSSFAIGWIRCTTCEGIEGYFHSQQEPGLDQSLRRADPDSVLPLINDQAFTYLNYVVAFASAREQVNKEAISGYISLVDTVRVLQDISIDAHKYLLGSPSAEERLLAFLNRRMLSGFSTPIRSDQSSNSDAQIFSLPGLPLPTFPIRPRTPCLFRPESYGRFFAALMRLSQSEAADGSNVDEIFGSFVNAVSPLVLRTEKLQAIFNSSLNVNPDSRDSITQFARELGGLTGPDSMLEITEFQRNQEAAQGSASTTLSFPAPFPIPFSPRLPFDRCRLEWGESSSRAIGCLCRESYRVNSIVNLERTSITGEEVEGVACTGDLLEIQGAGFEDTREWTSEGLVSQVLFSGARDTTIPASDEDLELWSDTAIRVRVPEGVVTGLIALRIYCRGIDIGECGLQIKSPTGSTTRRQRFLSILEPPIIDVFPNSGGAWCTPLDLRVSVRDVEEVVITDDQGNVIPLPQGEPGVERDIDTTITVVGSDTRTYTLTARNLCGSVTATAVVERVREFFLSRTATVVAATDGPLVVKLEHRCAPETYGEDSAEFNLTYTDPDSVLTGTPPTQVRISGSETEALITLELDPSRCGMVGITASAANTGFYSRDEVTINTPVPNTPRLTAVDASGAGRCGPSVIQLRGNCILTNSPLPPRVRLFNSSELFILTILELIPGSVSPSQDVRIRCELPDSLKSELYSLEIEQYELTSNTLPLTEGPLRTPSPVISVFESSRSTFDGSSTPVELNWTVRHAQRIEIVATGGGNVGSFPTTRRRNNDLIKETEYTNLCNTVSDSYSERIINSTATYTLTAYPFDGGGGSVSQTISIRRGSPPSESPGEGSDATFRGVKAIRIFNCDADRHEMYVYRRPLALSGSRLVATSEWEQVGDEALSHGYDDFGTCPVAGSDSLDLTFDDDVIYEVQLVLPDRPFCGENNPNIVGCLGIENPLGPGRGMVIFGNSEGLEYLFIYPNPPVPV